MVLPLRNHRSQQNHTGNNISNHNQLPFLRLPHLITSSPGTSDLRQRRIHFVKPSPSNFARKDSARPISTPNQGSGRQPRISDLQDSLHPGNTPLKIAPDASLFDRPHNCCSSNTPTTALLQQAQRHTSQNHARVSLSDTYHCWHTKGLKPEPVPGVISASPQKTPNTILSVTILKNQIPCLISYSSLGAPLLPPVQQLCSTVPWSGSPKTPTSKRPASASGISQQRIWSMRNTTAQPLVRLRNKWNRPGQSSSVRPYTRPPTPDH